MRSYLGVFAGLLAVSPAMGQVIIETPNHDAARHEQHAMQDRSDAQRERQEAQRRAAVGDYRGAADAQRDAQRDWRDAHRQQDRAQDESGAVVIGR
jgi:hypothetical protein